ncbi:MAG TPA: acyl-ACP desaturase [Kofleriaceae bacterium]|nr:acyl-ACP desaturase [Kofleriaceae bacterium]
MRYDQYYELWERNTWRVIDLDWESLTQEAEAGLISDFDRQALAGTAVIEHGVPHYAEVWGLVEDLRTYWQLWQFTTLWTADEHRHSFVLEKACKQLGMPSVSAELEAVSKFPFAVSQKASCPDDCYRSVPGMLTYAVIQELATNHFYLMAAKRTQSPFLKKLFTLIAGDEMRHHVYYRDALKEYYDTASDKAWYADQVYRATQAFKMPHLIYNMQVDFFEGGDWVVSNDLKVQLARCFSFDNTLMGRLMQAYSDAQQLGSRAAGVA